MHGNTWTFQKVNAIGTHCRCDLDLTEKFLNLRQVDLSNGVVSCAIK